MSLKKEMILAIILGAFLGALAALLITKTPQKLLKRLTPSPTPQKEVGEKPKTKEEIPHSLEILLPQDQALVGEEAVTISGKTSPEATVVITTPFAEEVVVASADGTFSGKISLKEGANEVSVLSLKDNQEKEKTIVVNYIKEEF